VEKSKGLWTICVHTNTARALLVDQLGEFLRRHAAQFTSVDRVLAELKPGKLSLGERLYESVAMWRVRASRSNKRSRRKASS
jgi:hypothetical protein